MNLFKLALASAALGNVALANSPAFNLVHSIPSRRHGPKPRSKNPGAGTLRRIKREADEAKHREALYAKFR